MKQLKVNAVVYEMMMELSEEKFCWYWKNDFREDTSDVYQVIKNGIHRRTKEFAGLQELE